MILGIPHTRHKIVKILAWSHFDVELEKDQPLQKTGIFSAPCYYSNSRCENE